MNFRTPSETCLHCCADILITSASYANIPQNLWGVDSLTNVLETFRKAIKKGYRWRGSECENVWNCCQDKNVRAIWPSLSALKCSWWELAGRMRKNRNPCYFHYLTLFPHIIRTSKCLRESPPDGPGPKVLHSQCNPRCTAVVLVWFSVSTAFLTDSQTRYGSQISRDS